MAASFIVFKSDSALAEIPPNAPPSYPLDLCNSFHNRLVVGELTGKIVSCIQGTIIRAVVDPSNPSRGMLPEISDYMVPLVAIMMVFGIMVFGIRILGGEKDLKSKAISFLLRIGLVLFFSFNLGGFALSLFDFTDELLCAVTQSSMDPSVFTVFSEQTTMPGIWPMQREITYTMTHTAQYGVCSPWAAIDSFVGRIFGFGQNLLLSSSLIGLVSASIFSSTIGIMLFTVGLMAFLDIVFLILRLLFMYLTSVMLMAFMIILSPLIIPMALFYTRENYFTAWLRILILSVLLPVLMFSFMGLFIGIFELLIDRIIIILGGLDANGSPRFDAFWRMNQPRFSWLMPSDANLAQDFESITRSSVAQSPSIAGFVAGDPITKEAIGTGSPSVQTFVNPYARRAMDASGLFVAPGVDFGPAGNKVQEQLILGFISLWIFSALMKSMLDLIPGVAQGIAKATINIAAPVTSMEGAIRRAIFRMGSKT
jgi:hypothetical protein